MSGHYDQTSTPFVFHHPLLSGIPVLWSFTTFRDVLPSSSLSSSTFTIRQLSIPGSVFGMKELIADILVVLTAAQVAHLMINPGHWDGHQKTYQLWWEKIQAWAWSQIAMGMLEIDVSQMIISCMMDTAIQGYVLSLYKDVIVKCWLKWDTSTKIIESDFCLITVGLHKQIIKRFTPHSWLELALHQLQCLKQGGQQVDEFLMAFDNMKVEANLSNDFALHILLQNAQSLLLEKAVYKYGELSSYEALTGSIQKVSRADGYIQTACTTTNPFIPDLDPLCQGW